MISESSIWNLNCRVAAVIEGIITIKASAIGVDEQKNHYSEAVIICGAKVGSASFW